jgi:hypothetical protein
MLKGQEPKRVSPPPWAGLITWVTKGAQHSRGSPATVDPVCGAVCLKDDFQVIAMQKPIEELDDCARIRSQLQLSIRYAWPSVSKLIDRCIAKRSTRSPSEEASSTRHLSGLGVMAPALVKVKIWMVDLQPK